MSVTDLSGTSWKFQNYPRFTAGISYNLNFTPGDGSYEFVRISVGTVAMAPALQGLTTTGITVNMYMAAWASWMGDYQIITITGGEDATNPECIAWIEQFATPYVDTYRVKSIELTKTAEAIRAKLGSEDKLQWASAAGFADAVNEIYLGTDTRDGTARDWDIASGKVAYVNAARVVGTMPDAEGVSF